ncbi:hypothetical protein QCA50_000344 [Cerrena zonata]|uniref:Secreted protein n=1 Tax=Cerrena zonata TaxID=2478898 RepID=A0AAW0GQM3_9APHY
MAAMVAATVTLTIMAEGLTPIPATTHMVGTMIREGDITTRPAIMAMDTTLPHQATRTATTEAMVLTMARPGTSTHR